jgi:hypothetical protein
MLLDLADDNRTSNSLLQSAAAGGKLDQALALYSALSAPSVPKPARLGALASIIREETSTNRPR